MRVIERTVSGENFLFCPEGSPTWYDNQMVLDDVELARPFIKPGSVAMDVGAHHGLHTLCYSKFVGPHGRVIAFEPRPQNRIWLRLNLDLNAALNVTVMPYAVGSGLEDILMTDEVPGRGEPVPATNLNQFASLNPQYIKVDVEGWEVEVLRGASKVLELRPTWLIEMHEWQLSPKDIEEFKSILSQHYPGDFSQRPLLITV
jgi:FkbM family methyltransferase